MVAMQLCNRGVPVGLYIYYSRTSGKRARLLFQNQTLYTFDGSLTFMWNMLFSHVIFRLISDPVIRRESENRLKIF